MYKFFHKHKTLLFGMMAIIFIALPFFGVGTNYFISSPQDVIIKINGEKVRRAQFDRLLYQMLRSQTELTPEQKKQAQSQALNELIRITVYDQEAKRYGIQVPDTELRFNIEHTPAFQKQGKFDESMYYRTVTQGTDSTLDEFEKYRRKELAAMKLNQLLTSVVHISDEDLKSALAARMAIETDPKKKKEYQQDPEKLRTELKNQELNWIYQDWLAQINSTLRVNMVSERFKKSLSGAPQ